MLKFIHIHWRLDLPLKSHQKYPSASQNEHKTVMGWFHKHPTCWSIKSIILLFFPSDMTRETTATLNSVICLLKFLIRAMRVCWAHFQGWFQSGDVSCYPLLMSSDYVVTCIKAPKASARKNTSSVFKRSILSKSEFHFPCDYFLIAF